MREEASRELDRGRAKGPDLEVKACRLESDPSNVTISLYGVEGVERIGRTAYFSSSKRAGAPIRTPAC